ncbi:MAG: CDP-glycerol glycerophosphotransferase family protein [Dehalococcoidales bacterium]
MSGILEAISSFIIVFFTILFLPISKTVRRNKNMWIFGSLGGKDFMENSKHLFLYINKYHKEIRAIWLSRNKKIILELERNGFESYYIYSLRGFYYSLTAKYFIYSNFMLYDLNYIPSVGGTRINLWHGIPLKKIGEDANMSTSGSITKLNTFNRLNTGIYRIVFHFLHKTTNYFIACSEEHRRKMCSAFGKVNSSVPITGYPRNDAMFLPVSSWQNDNMFWDFISNMIKFKYLLFYLPTFRDSKRAGYDLFTPYSFNADEAQKTLEKLDAVMIIKAHDVGKMKIIQQSSSPRIIFASNNQLPDIYPLLNKTNILLTDYSSVYFDFLLLDRPIIFTPFDLGKYINNDRQLYYDYDEVTPGPKARNWPEVFKLMEHVIERDEWKAQRELVRNRFHKYIDGNSSERVFQMIKGLHTHAK